MKRAGIFITSVLMLLLLAACGGGATGGGSGVNTVDVTGPDGSKVSVGLTLQLEVTVDTDAGVSEAVIWESSDESIATVDDTGEVKGISEGEVIITATSEEDGSKSDEFNVTVAAAGTGFGDKVSDVIINTPNGAEVAVGDTLALEVTVEAAVGVSKNVTWNSSNDGIATVNASGVVTGVAEGSVTITAKSTEDTTKSDSVGVTVTAGGGGGDPEVTQVVVTPDSEQITVGGTAQLEVKVQGDVGVSQNVTWKSNTPSIATVSSTGLVEGLSTGTVTITATSVADPSKVGSATVEVISCGTTALPSTISVDLTLTEACGPYTANDVTVEAALTIKPGVKITFSGDGRLAVVGAGTITAIGTASKPIVFTGQQPLAGTWEGIEIATFADNELSYVKVSYGGEDGFANLVVGPTGKVKLTNSSFTDSITVGVRALNSGALPGFANNTFSGNATGAMDIVPDLMGSLDSASDYSGNDEDFINVYDGNVTIDSTWPNTGGVPFRINDIAVEAAITVAPGAAFAFTGDGILRVLASGSLKAVGTSAEHITFKGDNPGQGTWEGIEILSLSSDNIFEFVDVSGGGEDGFANLVVRANSQIKLVNSSFTDSSSVGVRAENGSALPGFASNSFSGNAFGAMDIAADLMTSLDSASSYGGNVEDYINVYDGTITTDGTWPNTGGVPFRINDITVDAAITVEPGANFVFTGDGILIVTGSLNAAGTSSSFITFMGENPAPGAWEGILINSVSSANVFKFVEVSDGGEDGMDNIRVSGGGNLTLKESKITDSLNCGIRVEAGGQTDPNNETDMLVQNQFSGNGTDVCGLPLN